MNKLGFTEKEIGHMTYRKWYLLFQAYKSNFDDELILTASRKTYAEVTKPVSIDDIIPL